MKITNKISLSFFIMAITLAGVIAPISYIIARTSLKKAIFDHLGTTAQSRAHHVETFLAVNKEAIKQLAQSIVIKRLLLTDKKDKAYEQKLSDVMYRIGDTVKVAEYFYDLFVLDENGIIVASDEEADIGKDESLDSYFLEAKVTPFTKDIYVSKFKRRRTLAFSMPLVDSKTGKFLGVVVARSSLGGLNKIITDKTDLGETGEIFLLNRYGYMLTPSHFLKDTFLKLKVDNESVRKAFADAEESGAMPYEQEPSIYRNYRDHKVLGVYHHIPEMRWILFAEVDEKEALMPLNRLKILFGVMLFSIPILAYLISSYASKLIANPILRLQRGVEIVGRGNLECKVGTNAKDEVGRLSRAFDKMTGDLMRTTVSKDYVDNIIGSMIDTLVVAAPEGKIKIVNNAACELLGYKQKELIGKDVSFLFSEEDASFKGVELDKLIAEERLINYEINYRAKDGKKIPMLLSSAVLKAIDCSYTGPAKECPVYKEKGKHCKKFLGVVWVAKDITDRKKLEELKDEFISTVSHELRTPLSIIKEGVSLILDKVPGDVNQKQEKILIASKDNIDRLARIVNNLLDMSKIEAGKVELKQELINMNELVEGATSVFKSRIEKKGLELKVNFSKEKINIYADKDRVIQIFTNLLGNALKFTEKGKVKVFIEEKKDEVECTISDTGVGISEDNLSRVFSKFQQIQRIDGPGERGTGLGLSIVKGIIQMHRGKIRVESKLNKGTKFIFVLPKSSALVARSFT